MNNHGKTHVLIEKLRRKPADPHSQVGTADKVNATRVCKGQRERSDASEVGGVGDRQGLMGETQMKTPVARAALLLSLFASTLLAQTASSTPPAAADWLQPYSVVWDSPSKDFSGSMPLGNGDIAANVWVENGNELVLLLGKSDAWDENCKLLKLGRVRVKFPVEPFWVSGAFRQELDLRRGEIRLELGKEGNKTRCRIWVDANNPLIRVESESDKPILQEVTLETWRDEERKVQMESSDFFGLISDKYPIVVYPDKVTGDSKDAITWYHANRKPATDGYEYNMKLQGMEEYMHSIPHPLLGRVFGATVRGNGLKSIDPSTLRSTAASKTHSVAIYPLALLKSNAEEWKSKVELQAETLSKQDTEALYARHLDWWNKFWERSWIRIAERTPQPSKERSANAEEISKKYQLCRFMNACAGRGAQPIKFNGSLFTVGKGLDPDFRLFGGPGYWFQDQRHIYWPMLAEGDYDLMEPWFRMYRESLPFAKARCRKWFNHDGGFFGEAMYFWGAETSAHYERTPFEKRKIPNCGNSYVTYYWQSNLEMTQMMLDYYQFTGDQDFLKSTLIPHAEAISKFYDLHYPRTPEGKIRFEPAAALESWHKAVNPLPEIAGIRAVMTRLLKLPGTTPGQQALWRRLLDQIPNLPTGTKDGKTVLLPAELIISQKRSNFENPELYAVFPYRLFGVGKPDLELARDTFAVRYCRDVWCWHQSDMQAALLGLTDDAREGVKNRASRNHSSQSRFPAFWNEGWGWRPDVEHSGVLQMALQFMLMQSDATTGKIYLLPAWPQDWNAQFKLHAYDRTTVEGEVKDGKVVKLIVTPQSRENDVVICAPFTKERN